MPDDGPFGSGTQIELTPHCSSCVHAEPSATEPSMNCPHSLVNNESKSGFSATSLHEVAAILEMQSAASEPS